MAVPNDLNALVADRLLDMAAAQTSQQRRWGYRRAAAAVRLLDQPLDRLRTPDGGLAKIRHVGPASTRIILELIDTGRSPTIERAIAESGRADAPDEPRPHFLSRAQVVATLKNLREMRGPVVDAFAEDRAQQGVAADRGIEAIDERRDKGFVDPHCDGGGASVFARGDGMGVGGDGLLHCLDSINGISFAALSALRIKAIFHIPILCD